jgi:hypothetical protein
MPGAKECHHERAETHEHPFADDIRPFRGKFEQKREADNEIKKSPQHIDHGRGFADARRRGERTLELGAADPLNEVRDAIGQKQSSDEL